MTEETIKSGPDIVKEFVRSLSNDLSLDKETVESIERLYKENKLSPTKLAQALELKRTK